MIIIPLACTLPNLLELNNYIQKATGNSPIRHFDANNIDPSKIGAVYSYIVALELFLGNKITRITEADQSLEHISLTFGLKCDTYEYLIFMDICSYKISNIKEELDSRDNKYYLIITMTLKEWKEYIFKYSINEVGDLKVIFDQFYHAFNRANLSELFL